MAGQRVNQALYPPSLASFRPGVYQANSMVVPFTPIPSIQQPFAVQYVQPGAVASLGFAPFWHDYSSHDHAIPVSAALQDDESERPRLLQRLVRLAKGTPGDEGEMSSYASYETVAKGARKLASSSDDSTEFQAKGPRRQETLGPTDPARPSAFKVTSNQTAGINNMQAFLKETAHESSKDDPDFNLEGLAYVFRLLFMGTMQWVNRVLADRSIFRFFLSDCLRGVGQVFFMNNPVSGLVILIGLFLQSPRVAIHGVLGLVSSNVFAHAVRFDAGLIHSGLFGYNALLCGLALATFHGDSWDVSLPLIIVFISVVSAVLFVALGRVLVPYKVPPFTLPFNVVLFMYLLAAANMQHLGTGPVRQPALPLFMYSTDVEMPTSHAFFESIFRGVGQVFLADKTEAGIIISVGLLICSPTSAIAALLGSLVGNTMGLLTGAPAAAIAAGLYGYNSSLTFTCIFGMWYCPSLMTLIVAMLAACLSAFLTDFVSVAFSPYGLPAATLPFCICALLFNLIQGATPKILSVPLASMTVPEDHWNRARTLKCTFRVIAAIILNDNSPAVFARYMPFKDSSADKAKKRMSRAQQLFTALDASGDGILEVDEFASMLESASIPPHKREFLLAVFREIIPPRALGLDLTHWQEYLDTIVCVSTLKADLTVFFDYADLDGSGGLDAGELEETQKSLNLNLVSTDDLTRFIVVCGADEEGDVSVDEIISTVMLTFLRRHRSEFSRH